MCGRYVLKKVEGEHPLQGADRQYRSQFANPSFVSARRRAERLDGEKFFVKYIAIDSVVKDLSCEALK